MANITLFGGVNEIGGNKILLDKWGKGGFCIKEIQRFGKSGKKAGYVRQCRANWLK